MAPDAPPAGRIDFASCEAVASGESAAAGCGAAVAEAAAAARAMIRLRERMGNVVNLEAGAKERKSASGSSRTPRRKRSSKTALVLGGGGFTGGVYEIGALRALDLLSVNKTVNDFDIYVGTSAGSLVASFAANGITPEQMMRVVNDQVPTPFRDINLNMLLRL